jgi:predicted nucleic acid-binding protein
MADKLSILVDINIILDVVAHREPFYEESAKVLDAIAYEQAVGLLAAHSVTTLFYLINRMQNRATAVTTIANLLNSFNVAELNDKIIRTALAWNWKDFEDAVQMATAVNANADYIITRNPRDYEHNMIPVIQPATLFSLLP